MKAFSKVLSMILVVVMCCGLFTVSAYATGFDFGDDSGSAAGFGSFDFGGAPAAAAESDSFTLPTEQVQEQSDGFSLSMSDVAPAAAEAAQPAAEEEEVKEAEETTFNFESSNTATFDTKYSDMANPTFTFSRTTFTKSDTDDITVKSSDGDLTGDTFSNGFAYSTSSTGANLVALTQGSHYALNDDTLTIYASFLKTLSPGVYYFYGRRIDDVPVKLGFINVNAGDFGTFTVSNSPFDRNDANSKAIVVKASSVENMAKMEGFGVASVSGSYTHVLGVNEYTVSGQSLTLEKKYLTSLADGEYYLIGFPTASNKSDQVNMGKFIVKSGDLPASEWTLTPDNQVWYSGTDPLTFYSSIYAAAGSNWNFAGYGWDVILPDIRVSTRSNMSGATSVRIDQYWDLGYGYFMLGQNFLGSLSAEDTYYMQVIDMRHPDLIYSNIVSFRVGPTLRALDTDKHVINSTRSLRFRSSSPISRVYVGNIELTDAADYGVSWDGQTVTLSFEFLNQRTPGNTYTIKVLTTNGEYASTTFQILTTAQGSASPRTGDESNLGLWAAFLLLSGTAIVVMVPKLRKHDM